MTVPGVPAVPVRCLTCEKPRCGRGQCGDTGANVSPLY